MKALATGSWAAALTAIAVFTTPWLNACDTGFFGQDDGEVKRDSIFNTPIDSLSFWPPAMRYARDGDTISIRMIGLHRKYTCGVPDLHWNWRDTPGYDYYTLSARVDVPGGPSCEPGGFFDSTFRVIFHSPGGEYLFIRHGNNIKTDSLLFLSGFGYTETFVHRDADPDTAVIERAGYRFVFHDSTATRGRRFVTAVLPVCETFQSSIFKREGDSITVRLRRIVAKPLPASMFPACVGEHPDTMEVVNDLYRSF